MFSLLQCSTRPYTHPPTPARRLGTLTLKRCNKDRGSASRAWYATAEIRTQKKEKKKKKDTIEDIRNNYDKALVPLRNTEYWLL